MSDFNANEGGQQVPQPLMAQVPMKPHRGTTVLVLGIAGLATMGTFCGGIVLGIIAWVMGRKDLREMDRGAMDPEGRGNTQAGTICGIIAIPLSLFCIPILAAILFPVFMQARGQAKQATCLFNIKQLDLAILMFADDHNGTLPKADTWATDVMPYTKDAKLLHCPNDESKAKSSYAMNAALSGKNINEVGNLSTTVLIYETAHPGNSPSGGEEDVAVPGRHNQGNNFAFADGHCRWERETPAFGP